MERCWNERGISDSSSFAPIDYKQENNPVSKHVYLWKQMLKYVQDNDNTSLLTSIVQINHWKKKIITLIEKKKDVRNQILENFEIFKRFLISELVLPQFEGVDLQLDDYTSYMLKMINDKNYYYELRQIYFKDNTKK